MKFQLVSVVGSVALALLAGCMAPSEASEQSTDEQRGRPVPSVGDGAALTWVSSSGLASDLTRGAQITLTGGEVTLHATGSRSSRDFTVPKTADFEDFCHVRTIRGILDQRPVDGLYTEIEVIDRSHALPGLPCTSGAIETSVTLRLKAYDRIRGGELNGKASYVGGPLVPIPAGPAPAPGPVKLLTCAEPGSALSVEFYGVSRGASATRAKLFRNGELVRDFTNPTTVLPSGPVAADLPRVVLSFGDEFQDDNSFGVDLTSGNFAGIVFARVDYSSIVGTEQIANLPCVAR